MKQIIYIVLSLLAWNGALAQYASTYLYTKADGLPSTETHFVDFNKEGEMIVSFAPQGVYKYDGETFTPFLDTLISDINSLQIDDQDNLWIRNYNNIFHVTENEVLHWTLLSNDENPSSKDTIYHGTSLNQGFVLVPDQPGRIWFFSILPDNTRKAYEFNSSLKAFVLKDTFSYSAPINYAQRLIENNPELNRIDPDWMNSIPYYLPFDSRMTHSLSFTHIRHLPLDNPKYLLIYNDRQIKEIDLSPSLAELGKIKKVKTKISYLDHHLIILVDLGNVKHLYELDEYNQQIHHLKFQSKSTFIQITKDPYGTYWAASHEGLIRIFPQFTNFFQEENDKMLNSIHALIGDPSGKLWFGSYGQGIGYIQDNKVFTDLKEIPNDLKILTGAMLDHNNRPLFTASSSLNYPNKGIIRIQDGKNLVQISPDQVSGYYLSRNQDGQLIFCTNRQGLLIQKSKDCMADSCWLQLGPERGFRLGNVLSVVQDRLGRYWMTHHFAGISVYLPDQDTIINFLRKNGQYNARTMCTYREKDGKLYFGTKRGLAYFNPPENISAEDHPEDWLEYLDATIQPDEQFLLSLTKLDDQFFACSSDNSFHLYETGSKTEGHSLPNIYSFNPLNGYLGGGGEQNAIWINPENKNCWLANEKGISLLNFHLLKIIKEKPILLIDKIGETYLSGYLSHKTITSRVNKSFDIQYHIKKTLNPIINDYFIIELDQQPPLITRNNEIQLNELSYGPHSLKITGIRNGVASSPELVRFYIPRPYFLSAWFMFSLILMALLMGLAFYFYRENKARQRRELSTLRIRNLIDGLSPHFLGNSFNWIKNRAKLSKDEKAVQIIVKMDKITSTIFRNSRKNKATHSLREELMLLVDYFAIQKARYGAKQHYQINDLDPDLPIDDIQIPMMFLQILCENAIEHGLQKQDDGKGNVWVKVTEKPGGVEILIEDDGIGRNKASQMDSSGFGQSTKMLKELVNELNKFNHTKFIFDYEDDIFINKKGEKHGTKCNIFIPKKFRYEIPR